MCELENALEIEKCIKTLVHDCRFHPQTESENQYSMLGKT